MARVDRAYKQLLHTVINGGETSESRAGNTVRVFGAVFSIEDISDEFPLINIRKLHPTGMIGELAAFIQGADDLQTFKSFGCNYWDQNAAAWSKNKGKLKSEHKVGEIYGYAWRHWKGSFDQLQALVEGLKINPTSRRHLLTTYDPTADSCLPSCHLLAQFAVSNDNHLDCIVYMRSVDLVLGLPSDIVVYALLLRLLALETHLTARRLTFMLGDTHIYEQHLTNAKLLVEAKDYDAPTLLLYPEANLFQFHPSQVEVTKYVHGPAMQFELNV